MCDHVERRWWPCLQEADRRLALELSQLSDCLIKPGVGYANEAMKRSGEARPSEVAKPCQQMWQTHAVSRSSMLPLRYACCSNKSQIRQQTAALGRPVLSKGESRRQRRQGEDRDGGMVGVS